MDYFKHYACASESKSINSLYDKFGHKGVAFWWLLLELCCEHWDGQSEPEFQFHSRTVVTKLKSSSRSVVPWLELCSTLGMLAFAKKSNLFEIKLPKLMEVKTSRRVIKNNKKQLSVYKEEDKERDTDIERRPPDPPRDFPVVKIKPKNQTDWGSVSALWNKYFPDRKTFAHLPPTSRDDFLNAVGFLPEIKKWEELFQEAKKSEWLLSKAFFKFTWVIEPKNLFKLLEGRFSDDGEVKKPGVRYEKIVAALKSGADRISEIPESLKLTELEIEFIRDNGSLKQLNRMSEYDLSRLVKATEGK